jgi:excisionase family DNA binding protein
MVSISAAAKILGVSVVTLRRWDSEGRLPSIKTEGGHRRYDISKIRPEMVHKYSAAAENRKTMAYARVSSHDQKSDLERQKQVLELFCVQNGWTFELISDLGSGMNYQKKGLKRLLNSILADDVGRLVLTHKDRLLRFGAELVFSICEAKNVEVVIINKGDDTSFEEELATDVLEIITVFSARLYGSRSKKNKKMLEEVTKAVTENAAWAQNKDIPK